MVCLREGEMLQSPPTMEPKKRMPLYLGHQNCSDGKPSGTHDLQVLDQRHEGLTMPTLWVTLMEHQAPLEPMGQIRVHLATHCPSVQGQSTFRLSIATPPYPKVSVMHPKALSRDIAEDVTPPLPDLFSNWVWIVMHAKHMSGQLLVITSLSSPHQPGQFCC